eukprot:1132221-Rhodomonas_salina.1
MFKRAGQWSSASTCDGQLVNPAKIGSGVWDVGLWIETLETRVSDLGIEVLYLEVRVSDLGGRI